MSLKTNKSCGTEFCKKSDVVFFKLAFFLCGLFQNEIRPKWPKNVIFRLHSKAAFKLFFFEVYIYFYCFIRFLHLNNWSERLPLLTAFFSLLSLSLSACVTFFLEEVIVGF